MESLIKADIFFFVTTIAVVCLSAACIVISVYLVKILRQIHEISDKVKSETNNIVGDIRDLRAAVREEGSKLKLISELLTQFMPKKKGRGKTKES